MKKEIPPAVGWGIAGALVLVLIVSMVFLFNPRPKVETVSDAPLELSQDPDPPKPGQPGYRQRTTDTPLGGDASAAPSGGRGDN